MIHLVHIDILPRDEKWSSNASCGCADGLVKNSVSRSELVILLSLNYDEIDD